MSYSIKEADANNVVFVRDNPMKDAIFIVAAGLIFFIVGIVLNLGSTDFTFPFILARILFPLFGLIAIVAGINHPKRNKAINPEAMTFDNSKGVVIIEMGSEGTQTGYIRYDEIEKFDIEVVTSSGKNRTRSYHVYLRKKDGGQWFLFTSNNESKAQAILQQLHTKVALNKPTTLQIKPVLSDKLSKDEKMDKTNVFWEIKVSPLSFFYLFVFTIILLGLLYLFITSGQTKDLSTMGYLVLGFMFLIFILIIVSNTKRLIKDSTTRYGVTVGKQNFEYNEYNKSTEALKYTQAIPLQELHSITFTFSPVKDNSSAGLEIRTKQQHNDWMQTQGSTMSKVSYLMKKENRPMKLAIKSLNAVECLQLETWLQESIKKKGNEKVL